MLAISLAGRDRLSRGACSHMGTVEPKTGPKGPAWFTTIRPRATRAGLTFPS